MAVRLDRHDPCAGLGQRQRQGAQAGSDLEHVGPRAGAREAAMRRTVFGSATKF